MSDQRDYKVNVLARITELVLSQYDLIVGPNDSFSYSWDGGYERFTHQAEGCGSISYASSYHPDGYCWNGRNDPNDDGTGICLYCGRTLH